jgi:hypothetical protein
MDNVAWMKIWILRQQNVDDSNSHHNNVETSYHKYYSITGGAYS